METCGFAVALVILAVIALVVAAMFGMGAACLAAPLAGLAYLLGRRRGTGEDDSGRDVRSTMLDAYRPPDEP